MELSISEPRADEGSDMKKNMWSSPFITTSLFFCTAKLIKEWLTFQWDI